MRKRNIQKIVRFNRKEAQDLAAKAKKACLSEAGLIRLLIRGYEPKEKPDDRFRLNLERGIAHLCGTGFIKSHDDLVKLAMKVK